MGGTKSNIELITQDKKEQKGYKEYKDDGFISNSQMEEPKSDRKNGNILKQQASKNPLYDKSPSNKSFNDKSLNSGLSNSWVMSRKGQDSQSSNDSIFFEKPYQYEPTPIMPIKKQKPQPSFQSNPYLNPYGNHRPDFGMPPISRIPQILQRKIPRKEPLNAFVLEVLKLLGGREEMDTPLTKQHGEKLISARYDLPMHAPLSEKQDIYDIEEKAFETMQKPNVTLGDFYKNIGAIDDDDDQQSKNRSEVQKARIDMAKNRRAKLNLQAKDNEDTEETQTAKYDQESTDDNLSLFEKPDPLDGDAGDDKISEVENSDDGYSLGSNKNIQDAEITKNKSVNIIKEIKLYQKLRLYGANLDSAKKSKKQTIDIINKSFPDGGLIKENLLYQIDPNKYLVPEKILDSSELESNELHQKIAINERFNINLTPEYMENRGKTVRDYKMARENMLELGETYAKAKRIEEIAGEIDDLRSSGLPQREKNTKIRNLEDGRLMLWKNLRPHQEKLQLQGIKWNGSSVQMGGILQKDAKKYSDIYIDMLEKPGIPFVEYDPKGAAIQDKFEKGKLQNALELGFDAASLIPVGRIANAAGKAVKAVTIVGRTGNILKSGANARNVEFDRALKSANIDQTNPVAISKFFTNNPTALQKIKIEGLNQIMVEAVGGKISGAVAKKLSNGDAIAEKMLEEGVEKIISSGSELLGWGEPE